MSIGGPGLCSTVWASALAFACVLAVLGILLCLPFCLARMRGVHPAIDHVFEAAASLMGASPPGVRSKSSRRPAPKSLLRRLKVTPYQRPADVEAGGEDCCAICFTDFEPGEGVVVMPVCVHYFHQSCLRSWLAIDAVCPICKASLLAEEAACKPSTNCTCPRAQHGGAAAADAAAPAAAPSALATAAALPAAGSSGSGSRSLSAGAGSSRGRLTRPPAALIVHPPPPSAGVAGLSP